MLWPKASVHVLHHHWTLDGRASGLWHWPFSPTVPLLQQRCERQPPRPLCCWSRHLWCLGVSALGPSLLLPKTMPVVTASLSALAHVSEVPAMLSPLESASPMESLQEVELAQLVRSPGRYRRWQRLSLLRDGQLQQLQPHSARLCRHDHRQNPVHQSLRSNGRPSLSRTDWTLDTLDTGHESSTSNHNGCEYMCECPVSPYNVQCTS